MNYLSQQWDNGSDLIVKTTNNWWSIAPVWPYSSASSGQEETALFLVEQNGPFHHCKESAELTMERRDGEILSAPASFFPLTSYRDCAGSTEDGDNLLYREK